MGLNKKQCVLVCQSSREEIHGLQDLTQGMKHKVSEQMALFPPDGCGRLSLDLLWLSEDCFLLFSLAYGSFTLTSALFSAM